MNCNRNLIEFGSLSYQSLKGDTIKFGEMYRCNNCGAAFTEKGTSGDDLMEVRIPTAITSPQEPLVLKPVREAILEELCVYLSTGSLDYKLRGAANIPYYFCPTCYKIWNKETILSTSGELRCSICGESHSAEDIQLFTTVGYVLHRFGIEYRDLYEISVRRGSDHRYFIPELPPEVLAALIAIGISVISNATYDSAKHAFKKIVGEMKENGSMPEDANEGDLPTPDPSHFYKLFDLINIINSNDATKWVREAAFKNMAKALLYSENDVTIDSYGDHKAAGTNPLGENENDLIRNKSEELAADQSLLDEVLTEEELMWSANFFSSWWGELFEHGFEEFINDYKGCTRGQIALAITTSFLDRFNKSTHLFVRDIDSENS